MSSRGPRWRRSSTSESTSSWRSGRTYPGLRSTRSSRSTSTATGSASSRRRTRPGSWPASPTATSVRPGQWWHDIVARLAAPVRHPRESGRMSGGILPAQKIRQAIEDGWIGGDPPADHIQPASLDLRLGANAYALRCSFLPDDQVSIETKLADLALTEFDIRRGAVLERNRPYLIPLAERVALPARRTRPDEPEELDRPHRRLHARHQRGELPLRRDSGRVRRPALPRDRLALVRDPRGGGPDAQPAAARRRRRALLRRARSSRCTTSPRSSTRTTRR